MNVHEGEEHQGENEVANVTFKQSRDTEFLEHRDTWNSVLADL